MNRFWSALNNNWKWLALLPLLISCEEDVKIPPIVELTPQIAQITPETARIGDTLKISGTNLAPILRVEFNGISNPVVRSSDNEVIVTIPVILNESVQVNGVYESGTEILRTDKLSFQLSGVFEISTNLTAGWNCVDVQLVSDSLYFVNQFDGFGYVLSKSTDAGLTWERVTREPAINGMYFFSENEGLMARGNNIVRTSNGKDFRQVAQLIGQNDGLQIEEEIILDMEESGGAMYFLSGKGEIYRSEDLEQYDLLYDFPFGDHEAKDIEFFDLFVADSQHIWAVGFSSILSLPIVIYYNGLQFQYTRLGSGRPDKVHFFNANEGLAFSDGYYFSSDGGESWVSDETIFVRDFEFLDDQLGLGVSLNQFGTDVIYETMDAGKSWERIFTTSDDAFFGCLDANDRIAIFMSNEGRIFKYVRL